ncbi:MAG: hypothetical protein Q9P90_05600 [candidate division KSB1 bacterium]|nr:hypothetical protein [candidate division KSB1 bacterium]
MTKQTLLAVVLSVVVLPSSSIRAQDTTLTVTASGKVGIGLASPQVLLHVNGDMQVNSNKGVLKIRHDQTKDGWLWGTTEGGKVLLLAQVSPNEMVFPLIYYNSNYHSICLSNIIHKSVSVNLLQFERHEHWRKKSERSIKCKREHSSYWLGG